MEQKLETVKNPFDAVPIMTSARRLGHYDLTDALAELVDNSIKADARNVWFVCRFNDGDPVVSVRDDGHGMNTAEFEAAIQPASVSSTEERTPGDIDRFSWGVMLASFSQCRKLVVLTAKDHQLSGAVWDLGDIDDWTVGVLSSEEAASMAGEPFEGGHGAEITWQNCDSLSGNGELTSARFNAIITRTMDYLALVFLRFIEGKTERPQLTLHLNGTPLNPFHSSRRLGLQTSKIGAHSLSTPPLVPVSVTRRKEMKRLLDLTIPRLLIDMNGNLQETIEAMKSMAPFDRNWALVEAYVSGKGW